MSSDFDPLDELFPQGSKNVRAGGKFQPKVKPRPRKETSIKVPSSQPVQNIRSADNEAEKPPQGDLNPVSDSLNNSSPANNSSEQLIGDTLVANDGLQTGAGLPDIIRKPEGEEASVNIDTDPLDEVFSGVGSKSARCGTKFPSKTKPHPPKKASAKQPSPQPAQNTDKPYINREPAQENADTYDGLESFDGDSYLASTTGVGFTSGSQHVDDHTTLDAFPQNGKVVSDSDVGFHFNNGLLEIEEIETGPGTEDLESLFDMTTHSGQRSRKIHPTPKFQDVTRKDGAITSPPDGSGSVPFFEYDYTSDFIPPEDPTAPSESSFLDPSCTGDYPSGFPDTHEKNFELRERNTSMECDDPLEHQEASVAEENNEAGLSTRKLRKRVNTYALDDEDEDQTHDDGENDLANEHPEEEGCDDGENDVEKETQSEKKPKRSRKVSSQKEKPVRKRKKVDEAQKQATQKRPKKFTHGTRRNKRQVDKVLLETPEDEIDMRKLRIRDIILLAEHKERAASKVGKIAEPPPADQSAGTSFANDNDEYYEGEDIASEGGQFSNDQTQNSSYFNYHSYMKKTPRLRWSKQDTELFYQGVRQFGSDISMIQQLFPDRTRAQVKLKYKKEERQQPLMLHEALTDRSGDHSHFQRVIEQLQLAAQENQNSYEDDSIDLTGNGEEVVPETNEKVENVEKVEEREDDGTGPEAQSPAKSTYDSEDEDDSSWCQYKSDL